MTLKILALAALFAMPLGAPRSALADPIELKTDSGTLYGTLERPAQRGPWPVALLLSGSGPTNRDGGESDCLRLLAEGLAARGIASVRYDKRGVGASHLAAPQESELRFGTYVEDAVAWGARLRGDRRFSSLSIVGHSEGATIGLAACTRLKVPMLSLEGPGRRAGQVILEQLRPQAPPTLMAQATAIVESLEQGKTTEDTPPELAALFRRSVQPYLISWFRYDPAQLIRDLPAPALIVQGTTDLQVNAEDAQLLLKARPSAKLVLIEGMNHTLKAAAGDIEAQDRAYLDPALPLAPRLVQEVARWINSQSRPLEAAPVKQ